MSTAAIEAAARSWWNSISAGRSSSWSAQPETVKARYRTYAERALTAADGVEHPGIEWCQTCEYGTGWIVTNPDWPHGEKPYRERCPEFRGGGPDDPGHRDPTANYGALNARV